MSHVLTGIEMFLHEHRRRRARATRLKIHPIVLFKEHEPMSISISTLQQVSLSAVTSPEGTSLDGPPVWASSNPAVLQVSSPVSAPFTALAVAIAPGEATVTVSGDADLSPGVRTIMGTILVEVLQAVIEATGITINAGTPELKP